MFDANTFLVAGEKAYIGRTVNGGISFDSVGYGLVSSSYGYRRMWFADANTGYASAYYPSGFGGGVVKTTDAGLNWTLIYSTTATTLSAVNGTSTQNVLVASSFDGTMLKSTNGGTNWTSSAHRIIS